MRDTYGGQGSESRALSQWAGCKVLCLDDLGKERPTPDALDKLFALVDMRYRSGKLTLAHLLWYLYVCGIKLSVSVFF